MLGQSHSTILKTSVARTCSPSGREELFLTAPHAVVLDPRNISTALLNPHAVTLDPDAVYMDPHAALTAPHAV